MKKISILWIVLIIIVVTILSVIFINVSKRQKPYKELENDIVESMKIYYGQDTNLKKLPSNNKIHKVTLKELQDFGLEINNNINLDICDGYGIVKGKNLSHSYKAYIKCRKYTTKNY